MEVKPRRPEEVFWAQHFQVPVVVRQLEVARIVKKPVQLARLVRGQEQIDPNVQVPEQAGPLADPQESDPQELDPLDQDLKALADRKAGAVLRKDFLS